MLHKLIYLWQAWRGQHFFHTFEKSLEGWKKKDMTELLHHTLCLCVFVGLYVRDLCDVVGSVMRNGPIGQPLQEAEHWHWPWALRTLDLLNDD